MTQNNLQKVVGGNCAAGCSVGAKGWGKTLALKRKEKALHKKVISHLPNTLFTSSPSCIFKNPQFLFFKR